MASFYEGEGDMDIEGDRAPAADAAAPAKNVPGLTSAPKGGEGIGRINFGGDDSGSDDSDSEQQAFFAGGSSHSGNMVS